MNESFESFMQPSHWIIHSVDLFKNYMLYLWVCHWFSNSTINSGTLFHSGTKLDTMSVSLESFIQLICSFRNESFWVSYLNWFLQELWNETIHCIYERVVDSFLQPKMYFQQNPWSLQSDLNGLSGTWICYGVAFLLLKDERFKTIFDLTRDRVGVIFSPGVSCQTGPLQFIADYIKIM